MTAHRRCTGCGFTGRPAAWMLDHDARSQALIAAFSTVSPKADARRHLDNVTLYWLTNTRSLRLVSIGKATFACSLRRCPDPGCRERFSR